MHTSYLGIGSNVDEAEVMIDKAIDALKSVGLNIVAASDKYVVSSPYINIVVLVEGECGYDELKLFTKKIEADLGRTPEMKPLGIVPIDIDAVTFDGEVMRPRDYDADYFIRGYRQIYSR